MTDWLAIEGAYRAGTKSLRDLGAEHGISHAAIAKRAKKLGWVQDPTATKRAMVSSRMAGLQPGLQCALETIEAEAVKDVEDMSRGQRGARNILDAMEEASQQRPLAPQTAKTIIEAIDKAVSVIRTIRELDAPGLGAPGGTPITIQIALVGSPHGQT